LKTETQTLLHGNEDLVRKQAGTNREDSVLRAVDGNRPNNISGALAPLYSVVRESMASGATTRESVPSMKVIQGRVWGFRGSVC